MQDLISLPPEHYQDSDDDMKLRDDDKTWLSKEISDQIGQAIAKEIANLRPHGARRVALWLRDWGLVATVVTIPFVLLGLLITVSIFAASLMTKNVTFQTHTEDRLAAIEAAIGGMRGDLAKQSLVNHASMPLSYFKATLPDLSSAIAIAKQQKAKITPVVIDDLQKKLLASEDAPAYWPAVSEFINYRSVTLAARDTADLEHGNLPNCTDHDPSPMQVISVPNPHTLKAKIAFYENCQVRLDSPRDDEILNEKLMKQSTFIEFRHCLIVYNGGDVDILFYRPEGTGTRIVNKSGRLNAVTSTKITGSVFQFTDCVFKFSVSNTPPIRGQQMTAALLKQGTNKLMI